MAWKNGYYYRNRRQGGRVVTEYLGDGLLAELAAQLDDHERQARQAEREAFRQLVVEENAIDQEIDDIGKFLGSLVDALMLVNGYHIHRRQWRKKRGCGSEIGN